MVFPTETRLGRRLSHCRCRHLNRGTRLLGAAIYSLGVLASIFGLRAVREIDVGFDDEPQVAVWLLIE